MQKVPCRNMNHGRTNPPINFCPNCGDRLKSSGSTKCDSERHSAHRKARHKFCPDCGHELNK